MWKHMQSLSHFLPGKARNAHIALHYDRSGGEGRSHQSLGVVLARVVHHLIG